MSARDTPLFQSGCRLISQNVLPWTHSRDLSLKTDKRAQCSFVVAQQCPRRGGKLATPIHGSGAATIGKRSPGISQPGTTKALPISRQRNAQLQLFQLRMFLTPIIMTRRRWAKDAMSYTVLYSPQNGRAKPAWQGETSQTSEHMNSVTEVLLIFHFASCQREGISPLCGLVAGLSPFYSPPSLRKSGRVEFPSMKQHKPAIQQRCQTSIKRL